MYSNTESEAAAHVALLKDVACFDHLQAKVKHNGDYANSVEQCRARNYEDKAKGKRTNPSNYAYSPVRVTAFLTTVKDAVSCTSQKWAYKN